MCLIIADVKGKGVPVDNFRSAWSSNKDGAGLMHWRDNTVVVQKGIMTLPELLAAIEPLNGKEQFAVHFRFATHGGVSPELTHPFDVGLGSFLMHNGIVNCPKFWKGSDTSYLAEVMKATSTEEKHLFSHIDMLAGTEYDSKFCLFTPEHYKLGGHWYWEGDVAYSNLYSCGLKPVKKAKSERHSKQWFVLNPKDFDINAGLAKEIALEIEKEEGWIVDVDTQFDSSTDLEFLDAVFMRVEEVRG